MTGKTKIEWTDASWNPIVGCSVVSPGCTNCYAMRFAGQRLDGNPKAAHYAGTTQPSKAGPVWTGKVALASEKTLLAPIGWKKPRMIFVNSMGDLFHESVPDEWIDRVFAVMALAPQHTFQVLTKRAERMRDLVTRLGAAHEGLQQFWDQNVPYLRDGALDPFPHYTSSRAHPSQHGIWPLPNVWLGVSAEDQQRADERIPALLDTPAAVRFVSAEPLLGAIDFERILYQRQAYQSGAHHYIDVLRGGFWSPMGPGYRPSQDGEPKNHFTNHSDTKDRLLNWIIVGGESGRGARPMHPDWARTIRDQCAAAGVPFFFKQWGEWISASAPGRSNELGVLFKDGQFVRGEHVMDRPDEEGWIVKKLGKQLAGRLLDGVTHDGMPTIAAPGGTELAL